MKMLSKNYELRITNYELNFRGVIKMTLEERFEQVDFSQFSKVKDSLLLKLKLRRRAINEEMSLEELDAVAAAGNPNLKNFDDKKRF